MKHLFLLFSHTWLLLGLAPAFAANFDLSHAVIVVRPGEVPNSERTAATVLIEEVQKRCGIGLSKSKVWPSAAPVIAITSSTGVPSWNRAIPQLKTGPEGYRLYLDQSSSPGTLWVIGADPRGTLFGVGQLIRSLEWSPGKVSLASPLDLTTAPTYAIRGHQLGYRTQANSYDAWDAAQFEQYIRELTYFGVNSIEGIPFHDDRPTPVMKTPRREMNRAIGDICDRYGLDYWVWVPADFDLNDKAKRAQLLDKIGELSSDTKELTGFFFPGGDPGKNPPELVLPFLEDTAKRMLPAHPHAKVWLSLQWFTPAQIDSVYEYLDRKNPAWFAGLVAGPSGPSIPKSRQRLPPRYQLRLYPDLTHNKISQYEVPQWDQAYALTLGREAINPRPVEFAAIHNRTAPFSNGFISYSDGVHDDVNKTIWSALSWNPSLKVRDILVDYARAYFDPALAQTSADAILALEKNWHGPLVDNGAVEATLVLWQQLEKRAPQLETQWRWQMCLLRANYDAYIRHRLINETRLEEQANVIMAQAAAKGAERAMTEAAATLNRAETQPVSPELRSRIIDLCDKLFHSIGLQTSVKKYYASGAERGAVLDFVDLPLNNRWWLEDQFKKIRSMGSERDKDQRLETLAKWENPGAGSYYDNVGNLSKSPHVARATVDDGSFREPEPMFSWWDEGKSRVRLSWQVSMWPVSVTYEALDPKAAYVVRSTGYGQALLRVNGDRVEPTVDGREMGDVKEFPIDTKYLQTGKLVLTWDRPTDEANLNWRQHSRLSEVWLIRK